MEYLRPFKMVIVQNRAFSLESIASIEKAENEWTIQMNTGQVFALSQEETQIFKSECLRIGTGDGGKYGNETFAFMRQFLNWVVLQNRAINLRSVMMIEKSPDTDTYVYTVHLLGGWEIFLSQLESRQYQKECMSVIIEAKKLQNKLQPL
jgi:hypothetical protein